MNNLKNIGPSIYFKNKVDSLRNELINLGTFNYNIETRGINLTENFAVLESYKGNIIINTNQITREPKILNNIKKVTSFELDGKNTNPATTKKIDKLYYISDKIRNIRKLIWKDGIKWL